MNENIFWGTLKEQSVCNEDFYIRFAIWTVIPTLLLTLLFWGFSSSCIPQDWLLGYQATCTLTTFGLWGLVLGFASILYQPVKRKFWCRRCQRKEGVMQLTVSSAVRAFHFVVAALSTLWDRVFLLECPKCQASGENLEVTDRWDFPNFSVFSLTCGKCGEVNERIITHQFYGLPEG